MKYLWLAILGIWTQMSCGQSHQDVDTDVLNIQKGIAMGENNNIIDTATFAAGCFWCVEAQFAALKGVQSVKSGYIGGQMEHPTYKEVCTGTTGHAEAVNIVYDPSIISFDRLLAAFFLAHDPTQLNRQGNDIGTQYRSAIFPRNDMQKQLAQDYINQLNEKNVYGKEVETTIEPFTVFYDAEEYHDDYFANNPDNTYCQMVVRPKLEKFKEVFKEDLK